MDYKILGSTLGFSYFGKLPYRGQGLRFRGITRIGGIGGKNGE